MFVNVFPFSTHVTWRLQRLLTLALTFYNIISCYRSYVTHTIDSLKGQFLFVLFYLSQHKVTLNNTDDNNEQKKLKLIFILIIDLLLCNEHKRKEKVTLQQIYLISR